MSDDEYEAQYEYPEQDGEEQVEDPQVALEDHFYQASQLLRKAKYQEAKVMLETLVNDARTINSKSYQLKCLVGLYNLECKLNPELSVKRLNNLIDVLSKVSKKEKEQTYKAIADHIATLTDKNVYRESKEVFFNHLHNSDDSSKVKGLIRLGYLYHSDKEPVFFAKVLADANEFIANNSDGQKMLQNKLEMFSLEIQYLQDRSNGKDPRIREIAKEASQMKMEITDSRTSAIIKDNIGKMFVHEKKYQQASIQLLEAFKDYTRIGDPTAKTILKYAALVGILANQEINPFMQQEARIYVDMEEMIVIQKIREAFETKDIKLFNRNINSDIINEDSFMSSLVEELKEVVIIKKLKIMTKPYTKLTFGYLGLIMGTSAANIEKYLFRLITEGELEGRIDTSAGYYEKKPEVNQLLKTEHDVIAMLMNNLPKIRSY